MVVSQKPSPGYNQYFLPEEDLQYLPPYLRDVPETTTETQCSTAGTWPSWLKGTFVRLVYAKVQEEDRQRILLTVNTELGLDVLLSRCLKMVQSLELSFSISLTASGCFISFGCWMGMFTIRADTRLRGL